MVGICLNQLLKMILNVENTNYQALIFQDTKHKNLSKAD